MKHFLSRALILCALAAIVIFGIKAEATSNGSSVASPGARIHGVIHTVFGTTAAGKMVVLVSEEGGSRSTYSDLSGVYDFEAVVPGEYQVSVENTATAPMSLKSGLDATVDLNLQQTGGENSAASPASTSPTKQVDTTPRRGFFTRWGHAYIDDWTASSNGAPEAPAPPRRGTPAPLSSPPFPSADWPIGGTVVIGAPDYQTYPLMQAINENKTRFKAYGWVDVGANASTSNKGKYANDETAYDIIPNSIQLDQAVLYLERLPDTVQKEHFDWGFRLSGLYGLDYRYTTAKGDFSQQLLSGPSGQTYGADPVMYYADMYFPHVAEGMDLRIGRYISLPDIEAQLAPNNYTYSHSILYTFDCYTQHGVNATVKLSDHWTAQAGVSGGCEIAPWVTGAKLTGNFCAAYTWTNGGNNLYLCANSVNSGKYGYNNLSAYYLTYYHKINATWHTDTEGWYQYERDVPNEDYSGPGGYSAIVGPAPIKGANGAYCSSTLVTHCYAPEFAVLNYLEHEFNNHHASLNIRNEFVNDIKGQRTGTPTWYSEHLVGLDLWVGSTITVRPEVRFEHSYNLPAYDSPYLGSPTKYSQFTAATDVIYHF